MTPRSFLPYRPFNLYLVLSVRLALSYLRHFMVLMALELKHYSRTFFLDMAVVGCRSVEAFLSLGFTDTVLYARACQGVLAQVKYRHGLPRL
jgi:hypothetical protein